MNKILIVEDDIYIHNVIAELLQKNNYAIKDAYSGFEAVKLLEKEAFDLIILDLMLPAISGEEIIKRVNNTPIIVLSAKISSEDKVNCLLSGAVDYVTKPFDANELLARIKVQLRTKNDTDNNASLKFKDLELLSDPHALLVKNQLVNLTKTEHDILRCLLINKNQVTTKSKLLDLRQDSNDFDENALKVHISNIRKKIRKFSDEEYIESVWGIGFKMKD